MSQTIAAAIQRMSDPREALAMPTYFTPYWETVVHHIQKMVVERLRR